jgi:hypothetical protein
MLVQAASENGMQSRLPVTLKNVPTGMCSTQLALIFNFSQSIKVYKQLSSEKSKLKSHSQKEQGKKSFLQE